MSTGQNYRGFDIAQRVEIPCGAGFQPAQSPLRERLPESFEFLGYRFDKGRRWPRDKSKKKLRDAIRLKTKRTVGVSLSTIIQCVNPTLRGWYGYFKHADHRAMREVDRWIRVRLRSILRKRQKRRGRGRGKDHQRWPNAFFVQAGLFSLEVAHRLACQSVKTAH